MYSACRQTVCRSSGATSRLNVARMLPMPTIYSVPTKKLGYDIYCVLKKYFQCQTLYSRQCTGNGAHATSYKCTYSCTCAYIHLHYCSVHTYMYVPVRTYIYITVAYIHTCTYLCVLVYFLCSEYLLVYVHIHDLFSCSCQTCGV